MEEQSKGADKVELVSQPEFRDKWTEEQEAKEVRSAADGRDIVIFGESECCHNSAIHQKPRKTQIKTQSNPIKRVVIDGNDAQVPTGHIVSQKTTVVKNRRQTPDAHVSGVHEDSEGIGPILVEEDPLH
jgi:predicted house-cleaning NTP pyrophosphatase (Maf/HAM1 superfamily)